jgi:hypothetical protein
MLGYFTNSKGEENMKPRPIYLQLQRDGKRRWTKIGWLMPDGTTELDHELLLSHSLIMEVIE